MAMNVDWIYNRRDIGPRRVNLLLTLSRSVGAVVGHAFVEHMQITQPCGNCRPSDTLVLILCCGHMACIDVRLGLDACNVCTFLHDHMLREDHDSFLLI